MTEDPILPKTLGRYDIKKLLGAGAMGCVYLAEDPRIKRKVAIKVVKLDAVKTEQDRKEFLIRFEREAEISGILNDPGIVTIYDLGDSELGPFLAMEFVVGAPLDSLIKSGESKNTPTVTKLRILSGIASALDHAHAHGIVHRDVKPGNVMLTQDNNPKLMDFGIAKRDDASLTQTGTFLGTPSYASPEQIKDGNATYRSDIFSFGVLAFELLSGSLPFPGNSINTILYRIVNEPPVEIHPPVTGVMPDLWRRIFNQVLAKNPNDRHASCSAFVRDLVTAALDINEQERMEVLGLLRKAPDGGGKDLLTVHPGDIPPDPKATLLARKGRSRPWIPITGVGAGLVLLVAMLWLFRGRDGDQVLIQSQPKEATIFKGDKEVGKTAMTVFLKPGDQLKLRRAGFRDGAYTYSKGDQNPLVKLTEIVSEEPLITDPAGASVVMDDRTLPGVTPLKVTWNQGQTHSLTFTFRRGENELGLARDFRIGESPSGKTFKLEPASTNAPPGSPATLRNPSAYVVRIRVDGKDMGEVKPRGAISLPPGEHRVEISNPKVYLQSTVSLQIQPGQAKSLALPDLVELTVMTFPSSGEVMIDGSSTGVESLGTTPISLVKGSHTVAIKGFPTSQRTVVVQGNMPIKIRL
jgi:predicted Ser/Thr protein kinase